MNAESGGTKRTRGRAGPDERGVGRDQTNAGSGRTTDACALTPENDGVARVQRRARPLHGRSASPTSSTCTGRCASSWCTTPSTAATCGRATCSPLAPSQARYVVRFPSQHRIEARLLTASPRDLLAPLPSPHTLLPLRRPPPRPADRKRRRSGRCWRLRGRARSRSTSATARSASSFRTATLSAFAVRPHSRPRPRPAPHALTRELLGAGTGLCEGNGYRIGFGDCVGQILPAVPL